MLFHSNKLNDNAQPYFIMPFIIFKSCHISFFNSGFFIWFVGRYVKTNGMPLNLSSIPLTMWILSGWFKKKSISSQDKIALGFLLLISKLSDSIVSIIL